VTSLMTDQVREFILSHGDAERSGDLGGVVVLLALVLLALQSVLSASGRQQAGRLAAVTVPTVILAAVVVAVRLEWLAS
jgi:uncharacterized membrane protein YcjF (UPF0283 family)